MAYPLFVGNTHVHVGYRLDQLACLLVGLAEVPTGYRFTSAIAKFVRQFRVAVYAIQLPGRIRLTLRMPVQDCPRIGFPSAITDFAGDLQLPSVHAYGTSMLAKVGERSPKISKRITLSFAVSHLVQ